MNLNKLKEISIESVNKVYHGSHIGNDIILFDELAKAPIPNEPIRMNCLLLAVCLKGKMEYSVDTQKHTIHPNDIIILHEGQITDDYFMSPDYSGIAIIMSYEFFNEVIQGIHELSSLFLFARTHPVFKLKRDDMEMILDYFHALKRKVEDQKHHFLKQTVRSLMLTMIYDISNTIYQIQNLDNNRRTRAEEIFFHFIKMVEENFKVERRVSWYALQLNITSKYLSESVKQMSHRTPNEWIDYYVTLELRVLLRNTNKSIKEITNDMNFPNQSFLGKFFKEHVGMSPSEFRRS